MANRSGRIIGAYKQNDRKSDMAEIQISRLRAARERLGLTQVELSTAIDMSPGVVSEYERDAKAPSLKALKRLSRVLSVSTDWLLGIDEPSTAPVKEGDLTAEAIAADLGQPVGLRDVANDAEIVSALKPTTAEWRALASLDYCGGLTKDGYLGLLLLLRSSSIVAMRKRLEALPGSHVVQSGQHIAA